MYMFVIVGERVLLNLFVCNFSISVAIVIAALAGPQWLFTEEKLPNTLYNGTANFNVLDDGAFITRYTKSSLWIICTTLQGKSARLNCRSL